MEDVLKLISARVLLFVALAYIDKEVVQLIFSCFDRVEAVVLVPNFSNDVRLAPVTVNFDVLAHLLMLLDHPSFARNPAIRSSLAGYSFLRLALLFVMMY